MTEPEFIPGMGRIKKSEPTLVDVPVDESVDELDLWWTETVAEDIERTVPKIKEYGTRDLVAMGKCFDPEMSDEAAAIWACMFYAIGKATRAISALERGDMPSEDTLFDLSIYSMMARSYYRRGKL